MARKTRHHDLKKTHVHSVYHKETHTTTHDHTRTMPSTEEVMKMLLGVGVRDAALAEAYFPGVTCVCLLVIYTMNERVSSLSHGVVRILCFSWHVLSHARSCT